MAAKGKSGISTDGVNMKLFITGEEFVSAGVPYPGVPFLVDRDMELVSAPNQYLRYIATVRGRRRQLRKRG